MEVVPVKSNLIFDEVKVKIAPHLNLLVYSEFSAEIYRCNGKWNEWRPPVGIIQFAIDQSLQLKEYTHHHVIQTLETLIKQWIIEDPSFSTDDVAETIKNHFTTPA